MDSSPSLIHEILHIVIDDRMTYILCLPFIHCMRIMYKLCVNHVLIMCLQCISYVLCIN